MSDKKSVPAGTLRYVGHTLCTCRYVAVYQIHCMYMPIYCGMSDILCVSLYLTLCCGTSDTLCVCLYLPVCFGMSETLSVPAGMLRYIRYTVCICPYVAECPIRNLTCRYVPVCQVQ